MLLLHFVTAGCHGTVTQKEEKGKGTGKGDEAALLQSSWHSCETFICLQSALCLAGVRCAGCGVWCCGPEFLVMMLWVLCTFWHGHNDGFR